MTLKENGNTLFDGICSDTILQLSHHPKAGFNYSIEAGYQHLGVVSASTSVPDSITCRIEYEKDVSSRDVFSASEFTVLGGEASMWVTTYLLLSNSEIWQYNEIYANNMLVDNVNRSEGAMIINDAIGSGYHDAFLRVKNKNLSRLDEIVFVPCMVGMSNHPDPDYSLSQSKGIKIITASKEYDQYNRTFYQQKRMIIYDDDGVSAIGYQPIQVYSNIKNGTGIFAGMSEYNTYFPVDTTTLPPHYE